MCSFLGRADKLDQRITDLAEDLEDKVKDSEDRLEDRVRQLQLSAEDREASNSEVIAEIRRSISEQSATIQIIEKKFEKTVHQQQQMIDKILEKLAEVDFNRYFLYLHFFHCGFNI